MVKCLNCESDVPKYMTQSVDLDTFPSLTEKAKDLGYTEIRVCEDCYDELADNLSAKRSQSSNLHPYFQGSEDTSKVKE